MLSCCWLLIRCAGGDKRRRADERVCIVPPVSSVFLLIRLSQPQCALLPPSQCLDTRARWRPVTSPGSGFSPPHSSCSLHICKPVSRLRKCCAPSSFSIDAQRCTAQRRCKANSRVARFPYFAEFAKSGGGEVTEKQRSSPTTDVGGEQCFVEKILYSLFLVEGVTLEIFLWL